MADKCMVFSPNGYLIAHIDKKGETIDIDKVKTIIMAHYARGTNPDGVTADDLVIYLPPAPKMLEEAKKAIILGKCLFHSPDGTLSFKEISDWEAEADVIDPTLRQLPS